MKHPCPVCKIDIEYASVDQYLRHVATCEENKKKQEAEAARIKAKSELESDKKALEVLQKQVYEAEEAFMKKHPDEPIQYIFAPGWSIYTTGRYGVTELLERVNKSLGIK